MKRKEAEEEEFEEDDDVQILEPHGEKKIRLEEEEEEEPLPLSPVTPPLQAPEVVPFNRLFQPEEHITFTPYQQKQKESNEVPIVPIPLDRPTSSFTSVTSVTVFAKKRLNEAISSEVLILDQQPFTADDTTPEDPIFTGPLSREPLSMYAQATTPADQPGLKDPEPEPTQSDEPVKPDQQPCEDVSKQQQQQQKQKSEDGVEKALMCMLTGTVLILLLPLFRLGLPYLVPYLGDEVANKVGWCEFVGVHIALLGVILCVHGLGSLVDGLLNPHRFGVIAHASLLLLALAIANLTLSEFESHFNLLRGSRFYWFVPEVQHTSGVLSLVLCGLSLDLLERHITGLLHHLVGTHATYYALLCVVGSGLFMVAEAEPSLILQGYVYALLALLAIRGALRASFTTLVILSLLATAGYFAAPHLPPFPRAWAELEQSVVELKRIVANRLS